jgi:hypothetical protein
LARPRAVAFDGVLLPADKWHTTNDCTIVELDAVDGPATLDFR